MFSFFGGMFLIAFSRCVRICRVPAARIWRNRGTCSGCRRFRARRNSVSLLNRAEMNFNRVGCFRRCYAAIRINLVQKSSVELTSFVVFNRVYDTLKEVIEDSSDGFTAQLREFELNPFDEVIVSRNILVPGEPLNPLQIIGQAQYLGHPIHVIFKDILAETESKYTGKRLAVAAVADCRHQISQCFTPSREPIDSGTKLKVKLIRILMGEMPKRSWTYIEMLLKRFIRLQVIKRKPGFLLIEEEEMVYRRPVPAKFQRWTA